jgi:hypothetical protein
LILIIEDLFKELFLKAETAFFISKYSLLIDLSVFSKVFEFHFVGSLTQIYDKTSDILLKFLNLEQFRFIKKEPDNKFKTLNDPKLKSHEKQIDKKFNCCDYDFAPKFLCHNVLWNQSKGKHQFNTIRS